MSDLENYLEKKPLFYKEIDYNRMPQVWQSVKHHFKLPKIIHIVGTNGKGSTGRFLAWHLFKDGIKVGHYSSPHILKFNERIWLNGKDVEDEMLDQAHSRLQAILSNSQSRSLSYFEYTTLLAMVIFENCKYVVLEAGLGGEYDATSVFDTILTLATTIDLDHESFLGDSIKKIATTKIKATKKALIVGDQNHSEVLEVAQELSKSMGFDLIEYKEYEKAKEIVLDLCLPKPFFYNLSLAFSALEFLGFEIKPELLKDIKLFGRAQKISSNITIDVGHNPLAAKALVEHFRGKKIDLIFNSFADKDYKKTLQILKPIISKVEIIDIQNIRGEKEEELKRTLDNLGISYEPFGDIKKDREYLVFGSFSVVEEFLKRSIEPKNNTNSLF